MIRIREVVVYFENLIRKNYHLLKGRVLKMYLTFHGCKVGKGLKCKKWPLFRCLPNANMILGDHVTVGYNITFDPGKKGRIILEDHVNLTQDILISSNKEVKIGSYTMIAENVSIRDSDHNTRRDQQIAFQNLASQSILIGNDVWIGAGCVILKGATLNDGSVIGANSLVTHKTIIDSYNIYSGSPAKRIGKRN